MRSDYEEKILSYLTGLGSLTVFREINGTDVIKTFGSLLTSFLTDDTAGAVKAYHRLTYLLLEKNSRRLCGSIFADYIISWITENETVLSCCAQKSDSVVRNAAFADIEILSRIARFSTGEAEDYMGCLSGWKDDDSSIQSLTNAVWNGEHERDLKKQKKPAAVKVNLVSWTYDAEDCDYTGDIIQNVGERMMAGDAEGTLCALEEIFASCGTGEFLRYRLFASDAENLISGKDCFINTDELLPMLYSDEYERAEDACRDFANMRSHCNVAICGAEGSGKTTIALAIAENVPELKFVYLSALSMPDINALLQKLAHQPVRFAVIVDDIDDMRLIKRFAGTFLQPENVMFIALTDTGAEVCPFDMVLRLAAPELSAFAKYICDISFENTNADTIRNMCMDYQIETKKPLSYAAVKEILGNIR